MNKNVSAVSVGYCLTGWIGTAIVRSFGRDSLCYCLAILALCWYFTFGRFVKDFPRSYQHDTNVSVIYQQFFSQIILIII